MSLVRVFLDCTHTYKTGLNAGIQRVVRNLIEREKIYSEEFDVRCIPIVNFGNCFFEVDPFSLADHVLFSESIKVGFRDSYDSFRQRLLKNTENIWVFGFAIEKVLFGTRVLLKSIFKTIKVFERLRLSMALKKVKFNSNDILVMLDSFWTHDLDKGFDFKDGRPEKIVVVVYDIIPLNYPQFVDAGNLRDFISGFEKVIEIADEFLCISETVAIDLSKHFRENYPNIKKKKIGSFLLGSDFRKNDTNHLNPRIDLVSIFENSKVWISVGTLEPRKNHDFIISCFDDLWRDGFSGSLLIVGKIGWNCEATLKRIAEHPLLNRKLFFKNNVNDSDLQYCYANSQALVFASYTEGFGLPVVEAIQAGLKVLCSDIPIFREVGRDIPSYFSLENKESLKSLILKEDGSGAAVRAFRPMNWNDSARSFMEKILERN